MLLMDTKDGILLFKSTWEKERERVYALFELEKTLLFMEKKNPMSFSRFSLGRGRFWFMFWVNQHGGCKNNLHVTTEFFLSL